MSVSSLNATERTVAVGTTPFYTATLVDQAAVAVPLADISILTLTLQVVGGPQDGTFIRTAQNVLNANNVTVHATSGLLTWTIQVTDLAIADATLHVGKKERHVALFEWTLTNGIEDVHEIELIVKKVRNA